MTEQNKALAVQDEKALMAEINSLSNEFSGAIQVRDSLIKIPKIKLTQASSDQLKAGLARPGEFYCDKKSINFGSSVTIIPIMADESASLMKEKSREMLCFSRDLMTNMDGVPCKKCPHGQYWADWGTKDDPKQPKCRNGINVIAMIDGDLSGRPVMITFRKTSHKAGRELLNKMINDRFPFQSKYVLTSKPDSRDGNDFMMINPLFEKHPLTADEIREVLPKARRLLDAYRTNMIETEGEDDESEDSDAPFTSEKEPF